MQVNRRHILALAAGGLVHAGLPPASARVLPVLPAGLRPIGHGRVVEVVDGDTVRLDTREQVRFVGTQAPKLPLGRPGYPTWPFARESRAHLVSLVGGQRVSLHAGGAARDRHGRILAHLVTDDGTWIQGAMLEGGFARVYTFKDNRVPARAMLALEAAAREARRGLWADPTYRVRQAGEPDLATLADGVPGYHLVEGRVLDVGRSRGRWFLNFGRDHRTDFTATIAPEDADLFADEGIDVHGLEGRRVRIRGWIEDRNGASIDVTHPEQIELF
ncbi:thermonuclease family protein [Zavarzinia compransoris]|uniref:thermonuclease family protein n=1 Tax=Zavarzinia marina TaxID=2911065 RepID=UPI001F45BFBF|nr:thermonuclease family protein [Zavarzinia marina]MCF4164209.1 thermonuclease family protein [Zavarzinia marina]